MRRIVLAVLALAAAPLSAHAQEEAFRGKTLEILVGFGPGGGYDAYARLLGQFYGRHLPGAPNVVVRNMPGAGSLTVVNYIANTAPRNGLSVATFDPAQMIAPLMGEPNAKYDATKLTWVGSMADSTNVCISWHDSRLQSWDDMMKPGDPAPMGTTGPSDARHQHTAILRHLFNANLKMIPGYKGSGEVRLAMERGEIAGNCGDSWSSLKSTAADWLKEKKINVLAQFAIRSHPDLPDVPLIMDRARNDQDRAALRLLLGPQMAGRPYVAPPALPQPVVTALRAGFDAAMKDPDLLAQAQKMDLEISPVTGATMETLVDDLNRTPKDAIELAKEIVK